MEALVSTQWLAQHVGDSDLVVVDASWHMPASGRDGAAEYAEAHIPAARFLDIDGLSDRSNPVPHMLPAAADFSAAMEKLGVGRADRIIVYDNSPLRTAARGWFMLRHFGAENVSVLDGGLQKWRAEGRTLESDLPAPRNAKFLAASRAAEVVVKAEVRAGPGVIVDARSRPRFDGSEADPRPGVAAGHIPGSRNLPYAALYRDDGTMKSPEEIRRLFEEAGVDPERPFVATCGSGVTANSLILAAYELGNRDTRLYDGSWSEWGADPETPKTSGSG